MKACKTFLAFDKDVQYQCPWGKDWIVFSSQSQRKTSFFPSGDLYLCWALGIMAWPIIFSSANLIAHIYLSFRPWHWHCLRENNVDMNNIRFHNLMSYTVATMSYGFQNPCQTILNKTTQCTNMHTHKHTHTFAFDVSNCLNTSIKILYTKFWRLCDIREQIDCLLFHVSIDKSNSYKGVSR